MKICKIINYRPPVQFSISFPISEFFTLSTLLPYISLKCLYNSKIVFEFLANPLVSPNHSHLCFYIRSREIFFTPEDFHLFIGLFISIPFAHVFLSDHDLSWTLINLALYNSKLNYHEPSTSSLSYDVHVIQNIN